ncbi:MAG: hypothetical protein IPP47_19830 [Bryobacterales bacterium]|nr:hypothetical protein [Bryobacterales bacterium]
MTMLRPLPHWLDLALRALICGYAILMAVPLRYHVVQPGLDGSWAYALNAFAAQGVRHGVDVAFTYGPWGYLAFPMPGGPPLWQGLAAQTALWVAYALVLISLAFVRRVGLINLFLFTACVMAGLGAFHNFGYAGPDLFFSFLALLLIGCAVESPRWRHYFAAAVASGAALLLVKLSSGILVLSAVAVFPCAVWFLDRTKARQAAAIAAAAPLLFAAFFLAHAPSAAALGQYLRAGMEITSGYSAVMSEGENGEYLLSALWIALAYGVLTGVLLWQRRASAILALACVGPLFLEFKHSMVRPSGHVFLFFFFSAFAVGLVLLFTRFEKQNWRPLAIAVILMAAALYPRLGHMFGHSALVHAGGLRVLAGWQAAASGAEAASQAALKANSLPAGLLARLDGHTFSIFPWEITWAAPQLQNYRPFPVFQSYQAYTAALDEWNARFLRDSARGPEFLVVDWQAIDRRHPMLDVPATHLAMFQNYRAAGRFGSHLLLQRMAAPRYQQLRSLGIHKIRRGQPFRAPPSQHPLIARVRLTPSLTGRLRNLFYRLADVQILLSGEDGTGISARVPPGVLSGGIPLNFTASDLDSFQSILSGQAVASTDGMELFGDGLESFAEDVLIEVLELPELRLPQPPPPDPGPEAGTVSTLRFEWINQRGSSQYGAKETITIPAADRFLTLSGYAYDAAPVARGSAVYIEMDGKLRPAEYGLPSHGISIVLGKPELELCGFRWTTPLWRLPAGPHVFRIVLISPGGQRHYVSEETIRLQVQ